MSDPRFSRRRVLAALSAAGICTIAGCSGGDETETSAEPTETLTDSHTATDTPRNPEPTDSPDPTAELEIVDVSLQNTVEAGDTATITVLVRNAGDAAGSMDVELSIDEEPVSTKQVEVPPGKEQQVEFTPGFSSLGKVNIAVNGDSLGDIVVERPSTIYVANDGSKDNPGTEDAPLASIRHAVKAADPGTTVYVHPGEYFEFVSFRESGEPDAPITLTGPPDAVLRPPDDIDYGMIAVGASHIHITGLTISGLYKGGEQGKPDSYLPAQIIDLNTFAATAEDYIEGLVVSPHRIGHSGGALINSVQIKDCDIGGFKVHGPAGAEWLYDDEYDHHYGEIVYLGTAPGNRLERGYEKYDRTRNIRVHHIDNSEGYPHSELVDCKAGVENITIEYCTDAGGTQADDTWNQSSINLDGYNCTIRWNIINGPEGDGISIGPSVYMSAFNEDGELREEYEYWIDSVPETELERQMGKANTIHDNVITTCGGDAVNFSRESKEPGRDINPLPEDQRALCGNLHDGYSDGEPGGSCSSELDSSTGIGHLAGDSPWDGDPPTKQQAFSQFASIDHFDVTVHKNSVPTSEEADIPITVANNGDESKETEFKLKINQHDLTTKTATVDAGQAKDITLTIDGISTESEIAVMLNGLKVGSVQLSHDA